jgi:hypothetical protein
MTLEQAKKLVLLALLAFPNMQDKAFSASGVAMLWQKLLNDIPYEVAEKAVSKVLMTSKFFPTVAEIREAVESLKEKQSALPSAEDAWEEVSRKLDIYKTPTWSHPAIARVVKLIGFSNLCHSENIAIERGQFFKIYSAYEKREKDSEVNQNVLAMVGGITKLLHGA